VDLVVCGMQPLRFSSATAVAGSNRRSLQLLGFYAGPASGNAAIGQLIKQLYPYTVQVTSQDVLWSRKKSCIRLQIQESKAAPAADPGLVFPG
jgi:hypothetical protein